MDYAAIKTKGKGKDTKVFTADKSGKFVYDEVETKKYIESLDDLVIPTHNPNPFSDIVSGPSFERKRKKELKRIKKFGYGT
jgi:hypothetical protein